MYAIAPLRCAGLTDPLVATNDGVAGVALIAALLGAVITLSFVLAYLRSLRRSRVVAPEMSDEEFWHGFDGSAS